jgi:fructose-1,6-bisphosphatase II
MPKKKEDEPNLLDRKTHSVDDEFLRPIIIRATEEAAIACAATMGYGDNKHSDKVATEAMRRVLNQLPVHGRVVIGEGERDEAPMLFIDEELGDKSSPIKIDIAVDPLEGTNLCAKGQPNAICVMAATEEGGLMHAPDIYMEKIIVGPAGGGDDIDLDAPVKENLKVIAKAYGREVKELTIVVLDRDRHEDLINDIRKAGAKIKLIGDGDLSGAVAASIRGSGVHAVMGIGGAPEGVLSAAALKCLGGVILGRFTTLKPEQRKRAIKMGVDFEKVYNTEDLCPGQDVLFAATGVTDGDILWGVRPWGNGVRLFTISMSYADKAIRFHDTIRLKDRTAPVQFQR